MRRSSLAKRCAPYTLRGSNRRTVRRHLARQLADVRRETLDVRR